MGWKVYLHKCLSHSAAVAAGMKLGVYIKAFNDANLSNDRPQLIKYWLESLLWTVIEHGLSLFAASALAIRPFFTMASRWLFGTKEAEPSQETDWSKRSNSLPMSNELKWPDSSMSAEMTGIGIRHDHEDDSDCDDENAMRHPSYTSDMYNQSIKKMMMDRRSSDRGRGSI